MKRNPSVELYRCCMAFGVVMLHVLGLYGGGRIALSSSFVWCVVGFVFITGYFGSSFRWRKVLKLNGIVIYCLIVSYLVNRLCGYYPWERDAAAIFRALWEPYRVHWFIHSYVALLFMAPLVDSYLEKIVRDNGRADVVPMVKAFGALFFLVFGWAFVCRYNTIRAILPDAPCVESLTFLGIYAVARIFRLCNVDARIPTWVALLVFPVCFVLSYFKLAYYNSPVSLGLMISAFVLMQRVTLPDSIGRIIAWAGPSMLSVFVIHAVTWWHWQIPHWVHQLKSIGLPEWSSFIVLACLMFICSLALDMPRRIVISLILHRRGAHEKR